jgi:hypothetical protein
MPRSTFGQHNWPVWGQERIREFITKQRDVYKYTHDQTVRLMNAGHTAARDRRDDEAAEVARDYPARAATTATCATTSRRCTSSTSAPTTATRPT